jgi:hypothetical protein
VSGQRPWLAALLAVLYPGAGHLYLRTWLRAVAWFGLAFLVATLVIPQSVLEAGEQGGFSAVYEAFMAVDPQTVLPLFIVNALNVVDAYLTARRKKAAAARDGLLGDTVLGSEEDGETVDQAGASPAPDCPNCGRELDAELDFCPWCTTRLEEEAEDATAR